MTLRDKSNGWLSGMTYRGDFYKWLQAKINWLCCKLWHDEKIDKVGQFIEKIEDSHFVKNDLKPDRNGILLPILYWPTVRKNCSSDREKLDH